MNIKSDLIRVRNTILKILNSESERELVIGVESPGERHQKIADLQRLLNLTNQRLESS